MQDGTVLGDVQLPPWADGDPHKFILLHRQVSENGVLGHSVELIPIENEILKARVRTKALDPNKSFLCGVHVVFWTLLVCLTIHSRPTLQIE